jgi:glycine/D-amino acid oxidase-like deaminating enzyme
MHSFDCGMSAWECGSTQPRSLLLGLAEAAMPVSLHHLTGHDVTLAKLRDVQDEAGQIIGAEVHDELDAWGKPFPVHARVVINAGGPFSDSIRKMADDKVPLALWWM